jgi:hypothetical protein
MHACASQRGTTITTTTPTPVHDHLTCPPPRHHPHALGARLAHAEAGPVPRRLRQPPGQQVHALHLRPERATEFVNNLEETRRTAPVGSPGGQRPVHSPVALTGVDTAVDPAQGPACTEAPAVRQEPRGRSVLLAPRAKVCPVHCVSVAAGLSPPFGASAGVAHTRCGNDLPLGRGPYGRRAQQTERGQRQVCLPQATQ